MQNFASTGNGRRFLADVQTIAKSLKGIAVFCDFQMRQAEEDIWARLYEEDQHMYRSLKAIQEGGIAHGAADIWNHRLEDFLRQLKINYYTWLFHRITDDNRIYGTGNKVYSGHFPKAEDFHEAQRPEPTAEQEDLLMEAVCATVEIVTW